MLATAGKGKPLPAIVERVQNGSTLQVPIGFWAQRRFCAVDMSPLTLRRDVWDYKTRTFVVRRIMYTTGRMIMCTAVGTHDDDTMLASTLQS